MAIALPLLLLFGGLFMSADATFEHLVTSVSTPDPAAVWSNALVSLACAWLVGGFFRRMFLAVDTPPMPSVPKLMSGPFEVHGPVPLRPAPARLGTIEIGVILGLLNLLFGVFVGTQIGTLFGGHGLVQSTPGLGYADYARRGFFELAAVAALALPVLIGTHALMKREGDRAPLIYKVLSGMLIGLLFVVMASAALRMKLYLDVYGISMLRIYVLAIIAWLFGVFGWFVLTVLRDRPQRFAFGGLVLFLAVVFGLDLMNPEAMTARINTSRPVATEVDTDYLNSLSADAVPELIRSLDRLPPSAQERMNEGLRARFQHRPDWRSWNLSWEWAVEAAESSDMK